MYKKILSSLLFLVVGTSVYASTQYNGTFKGFQNIERFMEITPINKLQAIADNDGVEFSRFWPREFFMQDGKLAFFYLLKNEQNSLDIIKFDISLNIDDCLDYDNEMDCCIPKIFPNITSYVYNERLIVNEIPDFINFPKENVVSELVIKDNKYIGENRLQDNVSPKLRNTKTTCKTDNTLNTKSCKTTNNLNEVVYEENLVLKNPKEKLTPDNIYKYIKTDASGKKLEEYEYTNGKHTIYDKNGEIQQLFQINNDKFRYYNKKLPDLYIDLDLVRDINGRVIEEIYRDRNKKIVRKYQADYEHGDIKTIHVFDMYTQKDWYIKPIENIFATPDLDLRN